MSDRENNLGMPPPPPSLGGADEVTEQLTESVETAASFAPPQATVPPVHGGQPPFPGANAPAFPGAMPPLPGAGPQPAPGASAPQPPALPQMAGMPMPQFPQQTQPGPAMPGVPVVPGGAAPGHGVYVIAKPNPFVLSLKNLWDVQNDIWRGQVPRAFDRPKEVVAQTGSAAWNWLTPFLTNALIVAFGSMAFVLASSRAAGSALSWTGFADEFMGYYGPSAGTYFSAFFVTLVLCFAWFMVTTMVVFITHKTGGSPATWVDSATSVAVSSTVLWFPLAISVLLTLIFPVAMSTVVVSLGMAGVLLMYLLLTYIGTTRNGPHKRSPLVAYAWFTVLGGIVLALFSLLFGGLVAAA